MTAEPCCERTDLLVSSCAHCRCHNDRPADPEFRRRGHSFAAAYPGRCAVCDGRIRYGDEITRIADSTGYSHDDCIPLEAR